jgi:hypothetical protein
MEYDAINEPRRFGNRTGATCPAVSACRSSAALWFDSRVYGEP